MERIKVLNIVMAKVWGGGEQYVYDTALAMKNKGIQVYIAVDESNVLMQKKFSEVADVITCDLYSVVGLGSLAKLKAFIQKKKITILNVHSGRAMLLAILLKKAVNVALVAFKHNAIAAKNDFYHKWQRNNVDGFVCVSKLVYDLQIQGVEQNAFGKYHLIYNGIVLDKFANSKEPLIAKDCFTIGYAGRIAPDKGIDVLLNAFMMLQDKHQDIKLVIAGASEKDYLEKVKAFISKNSLEDKVKYVGHVSDMGAFYKSIDVFVLPSIVKEAFGLVLCEAMYCEVPVITTDSGAQKEIVDDERTGFIVAKGNHEEIARAVEKIYGRLVDVDLLVKNAREKVERNFNVEICVDKIIEVYQECLKFSR